MRASADPEVEADGVEADPVGVVVGVEERTTCRRAER
jgi:hypothetical protein